IGRDQVEPASRDHLTAGQSEHSVCDRITMMMIIKKPGIDISFSERSLYGRKIHGQTTILNNRMVLSESSARPRLLNSSTRQGSACAWLGVESRKLSAAPVVVLACESV